MSGSTGENGLWFGVTFQKPKPTAAMPLEELISKRLRAELTGGNKHDDDPIKHV